jgi:hypothetical protein
MTKPRRPARFRAGHLKEQPAELLERVLLSRERLAASDLAKQSQAWRLWSACIAATADLAKGSDTIYAGTLARAAGVHRNAAARLMRHFDALDVFDWTPAPRGSHGISTLHLPALMHSPRCMNGLHAPPTVHDEGSTCTVNGALPRNEVMSVELITHNSSIDTGTHRSSPSRIGASDRSSEDWEAERRARLQARPDPEAQAALIASIEADLDAPTVAERFAPYHGDERTGDGVGDDEASQLRWAGANPAKARAQRRQT